MPRWLSFLLAAVLALLAGVGLTWFFAYGVGTEPPRRDELPGLTAPVTLNWQASGAVEIRAATEADAYAGLGYAHGAQHTWSVVLWRQAALGRLAEWFGEPVLGIDRLSRKLGLGAFAQAAYGALPEPEQARLDAYAQGMNAAIEGRPMQLSDELALLRIDPEPWAPWHALALERLVAWLATTPPDSAGGTDAEPLADFLAADQRLRTFLHLYGFEQSLAFAARDSAGTTFFTRHVYGTSALPLFQEVVLVVDEEGAAPVQGATLPGLPVFPTGQAGQHAWSVFLTSPLRFEHAPADTLPVPAFERVLLAGGEEDLVAAVRTPGRLWLRPGTPRDSVRLAGQASRDSLTADSAWVLSWPGLSAVSDLPAWQALVHAPPDERPPFRLFRGDGLAVAADGEWDVLGDPASVYRFVRGLLVGSTPEVRYPTERLRALAADGPLLPAPTFSDTYSPWAAGVAPPLIAALDTLTPDPRLRVAADYLRNWDFTYSRASIGASLFELWLQAYRDSTGRWLPDAAGPPDTTGVEHQRRMTALKAAAAYLETHLGDDPSQWRWENIYPDVRYFPVWSPETGQVPPELPASNRYAPIRLPGRGHPTTLAGGPSTLFTLYLPTAHWEGWVATSDWSDFYARRRRFLPERFLGRHLASGRLPPPLLLRSTEPPERTTRLRPR